MSSLVAYLGESIESCNYSCVQILLLLLPRGACWDCLLARQKIPIGGAHQQTSERAAPPVSVEEKGKTTGDKRKMLLFLLMSMQY
jgi:hypothetical protein